MPEHVIHNAAGEAFDVDAIMAMRFPMDGGPTVLANRPRPGLRQRTKAFLQRDTTQDPRMLIEALDRDRKPARVNDFNLGPAPEQKPDMANDLTDELDHEFTPSPRMGVR